MKSRDVKRLRCWTKSLLLASSLLAINATTIAQEAERGEAEKSDEKSEIDRLFPEKDFYSKEEVMALRNVLEQKSNKLDQDIETQREYVESLKTQVSEHLAKIDAARNEIAEFMNEVGEKEETKLKKLARFYEAMEAGQASPLLMKIRNDLAIKIFDRMDTKKAGAILALFPPRRAARITAEFPRLKLQADKSQDVGDN